MMPPPADARDVAASAMLLGLAAIAGLSFVLLGKQARHTRAEADGGSALLGVRVMNAFYWALAPLVRGALAFGISANAVTAISLVLALFAGVFAASGHFGLAACLVAASSLADALDGLVARATKLASNAGEVLDAMVDRYGEFFFLGGVAVHFRNEIPYLVITLAAILASMMVSYASAKAEAMHVAAPRGAMRRAERAVYITFGAALTPFTMALAASQTLPAWAAEAPLIAALGLVALVGNVSAVRRFAAIMRALSFVEEKNNNGASNPNPKSTPRALLKFQVGGLIATIVDFGTMTLLVELGLTTAVRATVVGAALGAITNFTLGRGWIFNARHHRIAPQAARYAVVSATSALLNSLGEYVLHDALGLQYFIARALVAITVSLTWNFPMQRRFVFQVHHAPGEEAPAADP